VPLATALAGIASVHVGVNVWLPMPVFAEASNSLVAVGALVAAGSVYGKLTVFVAVAQPAALASQLAVGADATVVAVVGSVWLPDVNVVEVAVTFQPEPEPVASPMSNASVEVIVWFVPFNVVVGNVIVAAGVLLMNARLPALSVTDAVVAPCEAAGSAASPVMATAATVQAAQRRLHRFLTLFMSCSSYLQIVLITKRAKPLLDRRKIAREHRQASCSPQRHLRRSRRPRRRALAVAGAVTIGMLGFGTASASATIVKVQAGTYLSQTAVTSITPTLSTASTAGNLLTAVVATAANTTVTAPAGWVKASAIYTAGVGSTQIWYDANNAGAITSVKFTLSASDNAVAQLAEWSGVEKLTPLNGTGTATKTTAATTVAVSATAAAANELAIASFGASTGTSGNTFTPGSGWTNLMPAQTVSDTADYEIGVGSGAVSETETAATSSKWSAAIATFFGSCGGGSLGLTPPATAPFGSLTLNGTNQSLTANLSFTPNDGTASGSGWNITGTSTTFTVGSHTLPTTATTVTAGSAALAAGTCRLPTNSIGYPVTLPAAATAPAAVKIYDAAANTGLGTATVTLTFKLNLLPNAYAGAFASTWTFSIVSGP